MHTFLLIIACICLLSSITAKNYNANKARGWHNNIGHWLGTALSVATDIAWGWYIIYFHLNNFGL